MKNILLFVLFALCSSTVFAQDWNTNFQEAKKMAKQDNKKIVLVFSGSDWCGPCMKLDKEIWSTKEFQNYAESNFILVRADFPRRKKNRLSEELQKQNEQLAEQYNKAGYFPYVVVINPKGKMLGAMGYKEGISPNAYAKKLNSF